MCTPAGKATGFLKTQPPSGLGSSPLKKKYPFFAPLPFFLVLFLCFLLLSLGVVGHFCHARPLFSHSFSVVLFVSHTRFYHTAAALAPFLERSVAPLKLAKGAPGLQAPFLEPRSKFFDHHSGSFLTNTRQHIKRNATASLGTPDTTAPRLQAQLKKTSGLLSRVSSAVKIELGQSVKSG